MNVDGLIGSQQSYLSTKRHLPLRQRWLGERARGEVVLIPLNNSFNHDR